ncbi:DUF4432 family protein [Brachybacterium sp. AOP42-E1-35]|uniref:DUF4432 family protein n=1 Tax=Brachybacterium sp. AOP42-E1-35 TaxID=3457664 RepID=UPI00402AF698
MRLIAIEEGPARGMRLIEMRTAHGLSLDISVDRAFDLSYLAVNGTRVSWSSPTALRPAWMIGAETENGLGIMRGMTGMLVTGGLDSIFGGRDLDASAFAYPARKMIRTPLHGRLSAIPSTVLGYGVEETDDGPALWARGVTEQVAVFGEHLVIERTIRAHATTHTVEVVDRVVNAGDVASAHDLLYHVNFGAPFLSKESRVVANVGNVCWRAEPDDGTPAFTRMNAPRADAIEQCYQGTITAADGWSRVEVTSPATGLTARLAWDASTLPACVQWINAQPSSYAMAIEPATRGPADAIGHLEPGQERNYRIRLELLELRGQQR